MLETIVHNTEGHDAPEQRLWRAVLASVVKEWIDGPLRLKREAEQFLFVDNQDYRTVCFSAGVDPAHLRYRLLKIRPGTSVEALAVASQN